MISEETVYIQIRAILGCIVTHVHAPSVDFLQLNSDKSGVITVGPGQLRNLFYWLTASLGPVKGQVPDQDDVKGEEWPSDDGVLQAGCIIKALPSSSLVLTA